MKAILDGARIQNRAELHDALARELALPDWYGRNLDALFDCLTEPMEDTELVILHGEALREHLGFYANTLQIVLRRAAEENPGLRVIWE